MAFLALWRAAWAAFLASLANAASAFAAPEQRRSVLNLCSGGQPSTLSLSCVVSAASGPAPASGPTSRPRPASQSHRTMKRYILTGAPGAGKTTIIRALQAMGCAVVEEAATDVIAALHAQG